ncbi:MAG: triphosphoribosyl-dephospho-CoA synthase [Eubacteriales bacterium]|nr:triphosphoribosyl-dephospho-CoA synthase [Eubacteriales bacterium]
MRNRRKQEESKGEEKGRCERKRRAVERKAEEIGKAAWRALREEVVTTPKPGLVDGISNGAHQDMDLSLFLESADVLRPFFVQMALAGLRESGTPEQLFLRVRQIGKEAERDMLKATGGINTHKGAIFTMGLLCAAAGRTLQERYRLTPENILETERQMAGDTLERELAALQRKRPESHGEEVLCRYRSDGIRGEALRGYPSLRTLVLPVFCETEQETICAEEAGAVRQRQEKTEERDDWNLRKLCALMHLMSRVEDSNILYRKGPQILEEVHREAEQYLRWGGPFQDVSCQKLKELDRRYSSRGISAGGCADLLAAGIFLYLLCQSPERCGGMERRWRRFYSGDRLLRKESRERSQVS